MSNEDPDIPDNNNPNDTDDEDTYDENAEQMIRDIADHPVMDRVQLALKRRIQRRRDRIILQIREQEAQLKKVVKTRETIGSDLYSFQQQLAKLQMDLETAHTNCANVADMRAKSDEELIKIRELFTMKKTDLNQQRDKLIKSQAELDALMATIRQVEGYNEEMKGEMAVVRRAAYKAEEQMSELEKKKSQQDLYIDELTERLKGLREQKALYEAQVDSQRAETAAAIQTLNEASVEMETIYFEKKQLLQQWKASLIGLQKRDEALMASENAMRDQNQTYLTVESELKGCKSNLLKEQKHNADLLAELGALDTDNTHILLQLKKMEEEKQRLSEKQMILQKAINQSVAQMEQGTNEIKNIDEQIAIVDKHFQAIERQRVELVQKLDDNLNDRATVSKAAANYMKKARIVLDQLQNGESEVARVENEMARIKVDCLNTDAHNDQLQQTLKKAVSELKEKETLIEKYQLEIRQRNDEIEKEMYIVDRLNRKYDQLTQGHEDTNMGPLEATIHNLQKEIAVVETDNNELQQLWLKDQTILVNVSNDAENIGNDVREMKSRITVLDQKLLRDEHDISYIKGEVYDLNTKMTSLHKDIVRLNGLIAKNREIEEDLANGNYALEGEFDGELKDLQFRSDQNEKEVQRIKEEKNRLLDDIVEMERQIMLWEKKIQLEKETQAALDPNVGMQEARMMEKEIHRMQLRYDSLNRDKEDMLEEMERAVEKHELIQLKYETTRSKDVTLAGMRKNAVQMKKKLTKVTAELSSYETAIKQKRDEMKSIQKQIEDATKFKEEYNDKVKVLQDEINDKLFKKQIATDKISRYERLLNKYNDLREGKGEFASLTEEDQPRVDQEFKYEEDRIQSIINVIQRLQGAYPQYSKDLDRLLYQIENK